MGKSSPSPPDYVGAAQQQGQSQQDITTGTNYANRPNINTPWGSQTWNTQQQIDPATGRPVTSWTSNINLSPEQQAAVQSQQQIGAQRSNIASGMMGDLANTYSKPADFSGATPLYNFGGPQMGPQAGATASFVNPGAVQTSMGGSPTDFANQAMESIWGAQQPQLQQRRDATETQLANMGLMRGSDAWNREQTGLNRSENDARLQAYQYGQGIQNQLFNQNLAGGQFANQAQAQQFGQGQQNAQLFNFGQNQMFQQGQASADQANKANLAYGDYAAKQRQQQIAEEMTRRGAGVNEINALLNGNQVGMPSFPNFTPAQGYQTPDIVGAVGSQYGGQMDKYAADQQRNGSYASAAAMSYLAYLMLA